MKKLLLILTLLTTFVLTSTAQQEPATPLGNKNSAMRHLGRLYVDSVFYPPLMDYLFGEGQLWRGGAIQSMYATGNTGPSLPYYWTGTEWKRMLLNGDIPDPTWDNILNKPNGGSFIFNGTAQQIGANFSINGKGTANLFQVGDGSAHNGAFYVNPLFDANGTQTGGGRLSFTYPGGSRLFVLSSNTVMFDNLTFSNTASSPFVVGTQDGSHRIQWPTTNGEPFVSGGAANATTYYHSGQNRFKGRVSGAYYAFTMDGLRMTNSLKLYNAATDPAGENGDVIYNSTSNRFRGYTQGAFHNFAMEKDVANLLQTGKVVTVDAANANATDNRTGISVYSTASPFKTIQAAFLACANGDIIHIKNSTYNENVWYAIYRPDLAVVYPGRPSLVVLENATINGGENYAFLADGDVDLAIFLKNGKIVNKGRATDPKGTAALRASTARVSVYGTTPNLDQITSDSAMAFNGWSNNAYTVKNVALHSNKYFAFGGPYGYNDASTRPVVEDCNITSRDSSAIAGYGLKLLRCYVKGDDHGYYLGGYESANIRATFDIEDCYIEGVKGYAIGGGATGGTPNYAIVRKSTLVSGNSAISYGSGNGSFVHKLVIENTKITVTNSAVGYAMGLPVSGDTSLVADENPYMKYVNTITNRPMHSPTFLTSTLAYSPGYVMGDFVKEINTSTADTSAFYGVKTGFGTHSPTANVHVKGTAQFDIHDGTLNPNDKVMVKDTITGLTKLVLASALGGAPTGATATTLANFNSLYTSKTMVANTTYKITDRPGGDLYITAANDSVIHTRAIRSMWVPTTYAQTTDAHGNAWSGVWTPTIAAIPSNLVIWGTRVWKNLTGNRGTAVDDFTLDTTNWQLVSPTSFTKGEYTLKFFECDYDKANDWISRQYDYQGNSIGMDYGYAVNFFGLTNNPCDYTDWNIVTRTDYPFFNNHITQFLNNANTGGCFDNVGAYIKNNTNQGSIDNNQTQWGITGNSNGGAISLNKTSEVSNNSNTGSITSNVVSVGISNNSNTSDVNFGGDIGSNVVGGSLSYNSNVGRIWGNIIPGELSGNSNAGVIEYNTNTGSISNNTHLGYITYNKNNGDINQNSSTVSVNITRNSNNGNVGNATRTAHVTDTIVNK